MLRGREHDPFRMSPVMLRIPRFHRISYAEPGPPRIKSGAGFRREMLLRREKC